MNKSVLLVLIIAALTGIGCGALIWTFLPKTENTGRAQEAKTAAEQLNTVYTVTSPVIGTIQKRVPVTMHYDDDGMTASVSNALIEDISRRPVIAIYRENGLQYGNGPNITGQASKTDEADTTLFYLSPIEEILEDKPETAFIILHKNPIAKRLPLSALLYDDVQESHYVWAVNLDPEHPDRGRVEKHSFSLHSQDDAFFDIGQGFRVTGLVITHPDDTLAEGQTVRVRFEKLDAPIRSDKSKALYQEMNDGKHCVAHDGTCAPPPTMRVPQCSSCGAMRRPPKPSEN